MSVGLYRMHFDVLLGQGIILEQMHLDEMLQACERADAFGCFTDPSTYIKAQLDNRLEHQRDILRTDRERRGK
jgi:hypothetical protein